MPHPSTRWATACKLLLMALVLAGANARSAAAQTAYALLYGYRPTPSSYATAIATFDVTRPGTPLSIVPVTGTRNPYDVVAIDVRPATGELFALGYVGTQAQLYKLNPATGATIAVGAALTLNLGGTYNGNHSIGFSFDPVTDRIRVTNVNRTNYRLNPNNGTLDATDGNLTYASTDPNASQTPGIGSSAYTNSYLGATSTTLYDLDLVYGRLVTQTPANSGTLNTVADLTWSFSPLPFLAGYSLTVDLVIYTDPVTHANTGYLTRTVPGTNITSDLASLDLATGIVTPIGQFNWQTSSYVTVADMAMASPPPVLASLTGQMAYALAGPNLITFDTALPGAIRTLTGITGVTASQTLVGLDMRPATGGLYALGYDAAATAGVANAQLYTLDATTGAATAVGAPVRLELGTGNVGFDFNPAIDQIRVVGANRTNYRLHPRNGAVVGTDGLVSYLTNNLPTIGAVAYANNFNGATATTLYNYDQALNQLNTQATANPPADGQLTRIGASGIVVNPTTPLLDLDIYSPSAGTNTAYLVANTSAPASTSLYTVNLATGATTLVGLIGNGFTARNIAVAVATNVVTATRPTELATDLILYPNPSAGSLNLSFVLPRAARVELVITDLLGRPVATQEAGVLPAGAQNVRWTRGTQTAGVYLVSLYLDRQPAGTRRAVLTQ